MGRQEIFREGCGKAGDILAKGRVRVPDALPLIKPAPFPKHVPGADRTARDLDFQGIGLSGGG